MTVRALTVFAASLTAIAAAGCPRQTDAPPATYRGEPRFDTETEVFDLQHALQATVLENYTQLTLGNLEAYADGVARHREVALIGVEPKDVVIGQGELQ